VSEHDIGWFRERLSARPCPKGVIFGDEIVDAAADIDPKRSMPLLAEVQELIRDAKGNLNDWNRLVNGRRRERAERAAAADGLRRSLEGAILPTLHNACSLLETDLGERLSFNEMTRVPCLDKRAFADVDMTRIRRDMEVWHDVAFKAADLEAAVGLVAAKRSFHPLRDYLRGIRWDGRPRIGTLARDFLGAADALSNTVVKRTMIAAVARAENPGCKVDTVLVLVGEQGFKKSTFFGVLGGAWYVDSPVDIGTRQGLITMHSSWIYEMAEVEKLFGKKSASEIKAYVAQRYDDYVPPYGKSPVRAQRCFILGGTTNEPRFLVDLTGSRRWWLVPVARRIDAAALADTVDQLWGEAVACYEQFLEAQAAGIPDDENPHRWWLNEEEEVERSQRAERHNAPSAESEMIERWLSGDPVECQVCKGSGVHIGNDCRACLGKGRSSRRPLDKDQSGREYVTLGQVLEFALRARPEDMAKHERRVAGILRSLGWKDGEKRIRPGGRDGPRVTPYYSPTY
jgi:predicted P-loop ATPase